jgi:hypothetical protein
MGIWNYLDGFFGRFLWPIRFIINTSPRKLLVINNFIVCVCSICLTFCSLYVASLFYIGNNDSSPEAQKGTDWITWLGLAFIGLALTVTCIIGMRGAHIVSLELLMIYFWAIVVFIAPLLLGTIACFDFYVYMEVYFRHRWEMPAFLLVREIFCAPETASTKCLAPISGGIAFDNVDEWCIAMYNSTDCSNIRREAETAALLWGRQITLAQGIVGIINILEIASSLYLCYRILTLPVITQSMNDVINYLLLIPIGGCAGMGAYLSWMRNSEIAYFWLSSYFISMAVAQLIQIPLGIYAGREKSYNLLTLYIGLVTIIGAAVAAAGVFCILFSVVLPKTFIPTSKQAAEIACVRDLVGCCCCDLPNDGNVYL